MKFSVFISAKQDTNETNRPSYIGLLGCEYGNPEQEGLPPTHLEFPRATEPKKHRLIFVKGTNDTVRDPKMRDLVGLSSTQLVRQWFSTQQVTPQVTPQVTRPESGPSRDQVEMLRRCIKDQSIGDLMAIAGRTNRTKFRDQVLNPLIEMGLIEMTIPGKPTSSKQKYRLTPKGQDLVESLKGEG